jgi:ElaB/YqjD/DUF883 family membrane-anchored ribosome-binding protein
MPSGRVLCGDPGGHRLGEMAEAEIAGKTAKRARDNADKTQEAVKHFKPRSIKDQLMATLAVAPVIGFVLGALWRKQVEHV